MSIQKVDTSPAEVVKPTICDTRKVSCGVHATGKFIAVISAQLDITPFWIAKVKAYRSYPEKSKADQILVEWYQVDPLAKDPFEASYTPAVSPFGSANGVYESWISKERMIASFGNFVEERRLSEETKLIIKDTISIK